MLSVVHDETGQTFDSCTILQHVIVEGSQGDENPSGDICTLGLGSSRLGQHTERLHKSHTNVVNGRLALPFKHARLRLMMVKRLGFRYKRTRVDLSGGRLVSPWFLACFFADRSQRLEKGSSKVRHVKRDRPLGRSNAWD